ncbi:MAG TPA: hypothetical protein VGP16_00215 [Asanoa sp.]|jgi:hypothetical protein|nr:hypothetical protein [Asanoa sp.]
MEPDVRAATVPGTTRRDLLRKAAIIGVGAGALLTAGAVTASPAFADYQYNWRFCRDCKGMVFGSGGRCADTRHTAHNITGSWDYTFVYGVSGGGVPDYQPLWKKCGDCNALFYTDGYRQNGWCPIGDRKYAHDSYNSATNYSLYFGPIKQTQDDWRFCRNCFGLFFNPWRSTSVCPAFARGSFTPHDGTNSFNYQMQARTS